MPIIAKRKRQPIATILRLAAVLLAILIGAGIFFTARTNTVSTYATVETAIPLVADKPLNSNLRLLLYHEGWLNHEFITIQNKGEALDLSGWQLSDSDGNTYTFAEQILFADASLQLYTHQGENTPTAHYWGLDLALYDLSDHITLRDADGNLQAEASVTLSAITPIGLAIPQGGDVSFPLVSVPMVHRTIEVGQPIQLDVLTYVTVALDADFNVITSTADLQGQYALKTLYAGTWITQADVTADRGAIYADLDLVPVVVATRAIKRGQTIAADDVMVAYWQQSQIDLPQTYLADDQNQIRGSVAGFFNHPSQVVGKLAMQAIPAWQAVAETALVADVSPSLVIPPNTVAVAIPYDPLTNGVVKPDDVIKIVATLLYVDVNALYQEVGMPEGRRSIPTEDMHLTEYSIEDVLVVAIADLNPNDNSKQPNVLTVALKPEDATVLVWLIESQAPLTLVAPTE